MNAELGVICSRYWASECVLLCVRPAGSLIKVTKTVDDGGILTHLVDDVVELGEPYRCSEMDVIEEGVDTAYPVENDLVGEVGYCRQL